MRALLLYNPRSGRRQSGRSSLIREIEAVLSRQGFDVRAEPTSAPGSATAQVAEAIASGVQVVFACGGDGTINEVLQAMVGSAASLAIIPMGSANVLARELRIAADPLRAARQYAVHTERSFAVGRLTAANGGERYFAAMAGAGPDGMLAYRTLAAGRRGRSLYYMHALQLFLRQRFRPFVVRYRRTNEDGWMETKAFSAMALRVGELGGLFRGVARGASFDAAGLHLVLVRGPDLLSLPLWFVTNWLGLHRWNPFRHAESVAEVRCEAHRAGDVHVQIDGEWNGVLPMRIEFVPDALTLLLPKR